MIDSLLDWDTSLFLFLNGLGSPSFDALWMMITHKASNFVVYIILTKRRLEKTDHAVAVLKERFSGTSAATQNGSNI